MDSVIRAAAMYLALLVLLRLSGRRTLQNMTSFDLIVILVIGDAAQEAMIGGDPSFTNAILVIGTLLLLDIGFSYLKRGSERADRLIEGLPTILVCDGQPLRDRLRRSRVDEADVLASARRHHGITAMDEIRLAVLETDGGISIVPRRERAGSEPPL